MEREYEGIKRKSKIIRKVIWTTALWIGDCSIECLDEIEPDISDFGKTVFLTREEAEAALKEL